MVQENRRPCQQGRRFCACRETTRFTFGGRFRLACRAGDFARRTAANLKSMFRWSFLKIGGAAGSRPRPTIARMGAGLPVGWAFATVCRGGPWPSRGVLRGGKITLLPPHRPDSRAALCRRLRPGGRASTSRCPAAGCTRSPGRSSSPRGGAGAGRGGPACS